MPAKSLSSAEIKEIVRRELPKLVRRDESIRALILDLGEKNFAGKKITDERFDKILAEFAKDREENRKLWAENSKRWEENKKLWEENSKRWEESKKLWEENNKRWEESNKLWNQRWEENSKRWEENKKLWQENHQQIKAMLQELANFRSRFDQNIGAIGARWGRNSEVAFREALADILQRHTALQVMHFIEFDDEGLVFDKPDQVEIDVIIKNGTTILIEIKSYVSKADVAIFLRKAKYYEKKHQKPKELIIVTPQILPEVLSRATEAGIKVFSHAEEASQYLKSATP